MAKYDAYKVYDKDGSGSSFSDAVKAAEDADIVLFGEIHDNPIAHWLQLEMTKALYEKAGEKLIIGAEMFERDDQVVLDEYLAGLVSASNFEKEAKIWNNYKTDYKPVVDFAKEKKLKYIASNIPRRYASLVAKSGFAVLETLDDQAKKWVPKPPIAYDENLPGYQKIKKEMGGGPMHGASFIAEAQAVKDAAMAESIMNNYKKGNIFLHFNGAYHSNNFEGIYWYLKKADPNLKIVTISVDTQDEVDKLKDENKNQADYIIIVPSTMTSTY